MNGEPATSAGPRAIRALTRSSPLDWAELTTRRLSYLALVAIGVGSVGGVLLLLRQPNEGLREGTERPAVVLFIWLAVSIVVWLLSRAKGLSVNVKIDVGLVYLVFSCLFASLYRHWLPYDSADVVRGVSPVAITLLFFAVVVPVPPWRMAVAAAVAALTDVGALWVTVALGNPNPPWNLWVWLMAPNIVAVVLAVITSRFLYTVRESVERARELGSYRLVERLGAGGMGEVWRAEHRMLARPAAIKLIAPHALGLASHEPEKLGRFLQRFEREAHATAGLSSPHTIKVYDFGTDADGAFFYVMELLDGMDLQSLVSDHGALPASRAVHMLLQVCHSLREAHEAGLIHRDIKPANIVACRYGLERDFIKVLDFGLVKDEAQESSEEAQLTGEGAILGFPGYVPPELARGVHASFATDIYALGCVAFWLVTGKLVFEGTTALMLLFEHVEKAPPRPSDVAPHPVPDDLERVILACLEKDPLARPASISEVEASLRATKLADAWSDADAAAWWRGHTSTEHAGDEVKEARDDTLEGAPMEATTVQLGLLETVEGEMEVVESPVSGERD